MSDEEWSSDLDKQILAITNGNSDVIFKKLTEILAGLLLNVPLRSMTINGMMFKNVHWICQKLLRRGVCL
jgi:hypothetical protein